MIPDSIILVLIVVPLIYAAVKLDAATDPRRK